MIIRRIFLCLLSALVGLFCFVMFEASATATRIENHLRIAQRPDTNNTTKLVLLDRARNVGQKSWAHPADWHPGVISGLSAVEGYGAVIDPENARSHMSASRTFAAKSVVLSPVQPSAWLRLADYAYFGFENSHCEATDCLENSWRSGPLIKDTQITCARLRLANELGLPFPARREELKILAQMSRKKVLRVCLADYPEDLFFALGQRQIWRLKHISDQSSPD